MLLNVSKKKMLKIFHRNTNQLSINAMDCRSERDRSTTKSTIILSTLNNAAVII
jgi:hypothetical protein